MKSIILTCIASVAILSSSNAQEYGFKKSSKFVEGSYTYFNTNDNSIKSIISRLSIGTGYFLTDKFSIGPTAAAIYYRNVIEETPKVSILSAGVMSRYYFLDLGEKFKTYAGVIVAYRDATVEEDHGGNQIESSKANGLALDAEIGANYFITPKIALNFTFNNIFSYSFERKDGALYFSNYYVSINRNYNPLENSSFGLTFKF